MRPELCATEKCVCDSHATGEELRSAELLEGDNSGGGAEDDDDEPFDVSDVPDTNVGKAFYVATLPLVLCVWLTIPDCRRERFRPVPALGITQLFRWRSIVDVRHPCFPTISRRFLFQFFL